MIKRRTFMQAALAGAGLSWLHTSLAGDVRTSLQESDLVYITSIKSNGDESRCQAEIWFVWDGSDIYVCTASESWRARAPQLGLDRARIWVGDVGNWQSSDGKYKALPAIEATVSLISDPDAHTRALEKFGAKYPVGWVRYGPSFKDGLADGSRSLIRYRPLTV